MTTEVAIAGRELRLSNLDKVLYPAAGFTKRQLIDYYVAVADVLLPHIAGRPMTLGRWPDGVEAPGFAQTECRGAPEWLTTKTLELRGGGSRRFCVLDDVASLVWAANLGTLELHPYWGGGPDGEDAMLAIFDLDPGVEAGLRDVARMALRLRVALSQIGLAAYAKTTGGHGMHVFVPLNVPHRYDDVVAFCRAAAAELPPAPVRIDCAQNHPRRSLIAPYSLRAASRPAVSMPVTWEEVEAGHLLFTAEEVGARLERVGDLFRPVLELRQALPR